MQSSTRACALTRYDSRKISDDAYTALQKFNTASPHLPDWLVVKTVVLKVLWLQVKAVVLRVLWIHGESSGNLDGYILATWLPGINMVAQWLH